MILIILTIGLVEIFGERKVTKEPSKSNKKITNKNKIKERPLSKEEKRRVKYNKKRLKAYKSVCRQSIKHNKAFYQRKNMLVCWNCWCTGIVRCDSCGSTNKKRKKGGRCSKCKVFLIKIYCPWCNNVHYFK